MSFYQNDRSVILILQRTSRMAAVMTSCVTALFLYEEGLSLMHRATKTSFLLLDQGSEVLIWARAHTTLS